MATRREAREWAVQLLFQLDMNPSDDLDAVFEAFWSDKEAEQRSRRFTEALVRGVRKDLAVIDQMVQTVAEHWDIRRMGVLERNVIRLGVYELVNRKDIPAAVTINEAVDISKYFSTDESGRFVNGILDRIRIMLNRPPRD